MDKVNTAKAIKIGDRYFYSCTKECINTSWCLAGAKLFQPTSQPHIEYIEKILKGRGKEYEIVTVKVG